MKRLRVSILVTVSVLLVLIPKKIVTACGFYVSPGEYRFWLLQPDLSNARDLTPFFFASTYLYKGDQYAGGQDYPELNVDEWHMQIKGAASKKDIDSLLNNTNPETFFHSNASLTKQNSFFRYLQEPGNKNLHQYFSLSKKIETLLANPDPWGEGQAPVDVLNELIAEARNMRHQSKSPFIQLRAAYQLTRLYAVMDNRKAVDGVYDSLIAPVNTDSWIKTAALFQKAVNGENRDPDYLLSKVFDRGNYNRVSCLVMFNSGDLKKILPKAKNAHERTVLNAMKVFNYAGRSLQYLKDIYQAEPTYKELPFLLLREINKVEDLLLSGKVTEFPPVGHTDDDLGFAYFSNISKNYLADKRYAKELYSFIQTIIQEKKNKATALLNLYASHLSMLNEDYPSSQQHLDLVSSTPDLPLNLATQTRINKLLLALEMNTRIDASMENELLQIVRASDKQLGIHDPGLMKDQLILFMARKMIAKGSRARGLMLLSRTRRALGELPISNYKKVYQEIEEQATAADYDEMIAILQNKKQTAVEKFLASGAFSSPLDYYGYNEPSEAIHWDLNKLLDGKASWHIRNRQLKSALSVLKQIPDSFWKKYPYADFIGGDPFFLNYYHAGEILPEDGISDNKKEVIAKMLRLEETAKTQPAKAAECYYQLANAWYNMSYYGKNWLIVKQWWSTSEISTYGTGLKRTTFNDAYYGCNIALEYYLKAMKETKDEKLAALCCFMAGACNRNLYLYLWTVKNTGKSELEFKVPANPYLKTLRQKGMTDNYYTEVVKECATYNSFIRKYHKPV